jgi:hypothetical protein
MNISKYIYVFVCFGMIGKLYDDITELYLIENKRVIETIKTFWTILIFYFIAYYADNKYDIFFMMFVWTFLPLVDWNAYTEDPYFFSLVIAITTIGIITLIGRHYLSNLKLIYIIPCFILYCICSPITEILCFDFNGPFRDILIYLNILPKSHNIINSDLEVSLTKLITRIVSFVFLCIMIAIMYYIKITTEDLELSQLLSSGILLSLGNNGYFLLSIINQYYSIYINPDIMKMHSNREEKRDTVDKKVVQENAVAEEKYGNVQTKK